jgi:hypothetical protein
MADRVIKRGGFGIHRLAVDHAGVVHEHRQLAARANAHGIEGVAAHQTADFSCVDFALWMDAVPSTRMTLYSPRPGIPASLLIGILRGGYIGGNHRQVSSLVGGQGRHRQPRRCRSRLLWRKV